MGHLVPYIMKPVEPAWSWTNNIFIYGDSTYLSFRNFSRVLILFLPASYFTFIYLQSLLKTHCLHGMFLRVHRHYDVAFLVCKKSPLHSTPLHSTPPNWVLFFLFFFVLIFVRLERLPFALLMSYLIFCWVNIRSAKYLVFSFFLN